MADYAIPAWVKHVPREDFVMFEAVSKTGETFAVDAGTNPSEQSVQAAVSSLRTAIFEAEYPGEMSALGVRYARSVVYDTPFTDADKAMVARQAELGIRGIL